MKTALILVSAIIVLLMLTPLTTQAQDIVYTKDGSMFKGRIVEEAPGVRLILQDMAGNRHSISWDTIDRIQRGEWQGKKSGALSWALSFFLLPGLGQFYNGDTGKGAVMTVSAVGGYALMLTSEDAAPLGAVVFLGVWIWSFIDAPIRSGAINRSRGYAALPQTYPAGRPYCDGILRECGGVDQRPIVLAALQLRF